MSTTNFRPGNNTSALKRLIYIAQLNAINKNTNNINCLCIPDNYNKQIPGSYSGSYFCSFFLSYLFTFLT
jgi:hypothetical protein